MDGGRDPKVGLDCWGLLSTVAERYGYKVPDYEIGCHDTVRIIGQVDSDLKDWTRVEDPVPGCVVLMSLDPEMPDCIQHFGVYIGSGRFLHTLKKTGSCLASVHDRFWSGRIKGFYSWTR